MKLFNTKSGQKEEVKKRTPFLMYTCGPTVYDFAHIGNYRTFTAEDILRRALNYFGFEVKQVMNITDVDDKTIKGANQMNLSLKEYTEPFIEAFFKDLKTLNIQKVEHYPLATDYIALMVEMIELLLANKVAYKGSDGSIYFSLEAFPNYGRLSNLNLEKLQKRKGSHSFDEYDKEHATDFVLWKAYNEKRDGSIFWESSFGKGRPGWHLECSAMAVNILGNSIDLHAGGVDNIFPHHENEIAQTESVTNKMFVKYWFHVAHLQVNSKKMSKSTGNYYTLRDLLKDGHTGREIRYLLLSSYYRTPLNFTISGLTAAKQSLHRIDYFLKRLESVRGENSSELFKLELEKAKSGFEEALKDDLNMPLALSYLYDFIRFVNQLIDKEKLSQTQGAAAKALLSRMDQVLGILPSKPSQLPQEILDMANQRFKARSERNFILADKLRAQVEEEGYIIEDRADGFDVTMK